jgi:hypothetical protein
VIPRLSLRADASFCIDTGADRTILLPSDAARMGVDRSLLRNMSSTLGIGGATNMFDEPATIVFSEGLDRVYVYDVTLKIAPLTRGLRDVPSILGRDVINHWRIDYHPTRGRLVVEVQRADRTIELP